MACIIHKNGEKKFTLIMAESQQDTQKVWEHFIKNNLVKHYKFKLCEVELSSHGSTTAMHKRLKQTHECPSRHGQTGISNFMVNNNDLN